MATVNISHVINDQHVTSSIDPVTDHIVVDNEVTIVTDVTDNDDGSNIVASTEHSEVVQSSSNISILIPSHKEGIYIHNMHSYTHMCMYVYAYMLITYILLHIIALLHISRCCSSSSYPTMY